MNLRTNPETDKAEVQVDEDEWVSIDDLMAEAEKENRTLRTHIKEKYGRVVE